MNVALSPEFEQLLVEEVANGRFASPRDVIEEGLRLLMEERRWRHAVRRQVAEGIAQAKAGRLVDGEAAFDELDDRLATQVP